MRPLAQTHNRPSHHKPGRSHSRSTDGDPVIRAREHGDFLLQAQVAEPASDAEYLGEQDEQIRPLKHSSLSARLGPRDGLRPGHVTPETDQGQDIAKTKVIRFSLLSADKQARSTFVLMTI